MKRIFAAALVLGFAGSVLAQTQPPKADPQKTKQTDAVSAKAAEEIKQIRAEVQKDRNALVAAGMQLTDKEAGVFWPLYTEYRAAMTKAVGDRAMKLVFDYANKEKTLTDAEASKLMTEWLAIQKTELELKTAWFAKFSEKLSGKTVARFFQVENKLDTIVRFQLVAEIPLVQ